MYAEASKTLGGLPISGQRIHLIASYFFERTTATMLTTAPVGMPCHDLLTQRDAQHNNVEHILPRSRSLIMVEIAPASLRAHRRRSGNVSRY
jgi:hypothetical protein